MAFKKSGSISRLNQLADAIALRDPNTNNYYPAPGSFQASSALFACAAANTATTVTLAAPGSGKAWVISGLITTLAGGTPGTLLKAVTTYTGAASTDYTAGDTITIGAPGSGGNTVYTFRAAVAATNDVKLGGSADASLLNFARAINNSGGTAGADYLVTAANPYITSTATVTSHVITLTAIIPGTWANGIRTTQAVSNSATGWAGATVNSGTPGTGSALIVQDGTVTAAGVSGVPNIVFAIGFGVSAGNEKIVLNPPLKCTSGNAVTVTLSAGGSSVIGALNVLATAQ